MNNVAVYDPQSGIIYRQFSERQEENGNFLQLQSYIDEGMVPADALAHIFDRQADPLQEKVDVTADPLALIPYVRVPARAELEAAINVERERRIVAGASFDGIKITGRDVDRANLSDLAFAAQLRLSTGDNTTITIFRDGDNIDHGLTPAQIIALWQQSAGYVSQLYAASWAIKAMEPIPSDYVNDQFWIAASAL